MTRPATPIDDFDHRLLTQPIEPPPIGEAEPSQTHPATNSDDDNGNDGEDTNNADFVDTPTEEAPQQHDSTNEEDNLTHAPTFAIDAELERLYGQPIAHTDGLSESGGVADDSTWQRRFDRLATIKTRQYALPSGAVGKEFLALFVDEWNGIRNRTWNSERPLVCLLVILQRADGVKKSSDIRSRIRQRVQLWKEGLFDSLVDDTVTEVTGRTHTNHHRTDEVSKARAFNGQVLSGRLRKAVRNLTNRDQGGVMDPHDLCTKTGRPVLEVLQSKHPAPRPTDIHEDNSFEKYSTPPPTAIPLDVSADHVEKIASRLSGAAGVDGIDGVELRNWLLRFGEHSLRLRQAMADTVAWLANTHPPWAAYRALAACRLVALDKKPGTRPVGIGSVFRRLLSKVLLLIAGGQASQACGNTNLCAGLPAGIEGAVHALNETTATSTNASPEEHNNEGSSVAPPPLATADAIDDPVVTILVDASNGFNELNRGAMLRTVRYLWPKGAKFAFNWYKRQSRLYLRHRDSHDSTIILSREGVTQGDPLSMVLFGLAVTPLGNHLRSTHPNILQLWYADDFGLKGRASKARKVLEDVCSLGRSIGFFVEPTKSIAICPEPQQPAAKTHLQGLDLEFLLGSRYLGGYIGDKDGIEDWIKPKIQAWIQGIADLAKVARRFPQTAFAGMSKSYQQEWAFLQRVVPDSGPLFTEVEAAIDQIFLPALFPEGSQLPDGFREFSARPVRYAGLGLPNPVEHAEGQHSASVAITAELTKSLLDHAPLDATNYRKEASSTRSKLKSERDSAHAASLQAQLAQGNRQKQRRIKRAGDTGLWLTMAPDTLNGTELSAEEFRDNLCLRYGITLPDLPDKCDGCGAPFTMEHAVSCKQGGLILRRHNDLCKEWHALCAQALTPTAVTDEPLIHSSRPAQGANANGTSNDSANNPPASTPPDTRGDVAVHGFWSRHNTTIFDVRITDVDAPSYRGQDPSKVLRRQEKEKKDKHLQACLDRRRHFTPLVFSIDGLRAPEADAACKRLAQTLAIKWKRTYSQVCAFVRSRMAISLARSSSMCFRGARDPTARSRHYTWEAAGAGLGLYR